MNPAQTSLPESPVLNPLPGVLTDEALVSCLGIGVLATGLLFSAMALFGPAVPPSIGATRKTRFTTSGAVTILLLLASLVTGGWRELLMAQDDAEKNRQLETMATRLEKIEKQTDSEELVKSLLAAFQSEWKEAQLDVLATQSRGGATGPEIELKPLPPSIVSKLEEIALRLGARLPDDPAATKENHK